MKALHAAPRTESGCESPFRFAERRSSAAADRLLSNSDSSRLRLQPPAFCCTLHSFFFLSHSLILLSFYCNPWLSWGGRPVTRSVTRFSLSEKVNSFLLNSVKYYSSIISIQIDVICKQEHSTREKIFSQIAKKLIKFQLHFTLLKTELMHSLNCNEIHVGFLVSILS